MTDIVERLRQWAGFGYGRGSLRATMREAADEITRLRAENEKLQAALEPFACDCAVNERCAVPDNCRNFQARRTLKEKP